MPDAETLTLPLHCVRCGEAVYVVYESRGTYQRGFWNCPYRGCEHLNKMELKGAVLTAVARYEPAKD